MKIGIADRLLYCLKYCFLFVRGNRTAILAVLTLFCALLLIMSRSPVYNVDNEVKRIERNVNKRLALLNDYVDEVKNTPPTDSWPYLKGFPEDMISTGIIRILSNFGKTSFP